MLKLYKSGVSLIVLVITIIVIIILSGAVLLSLAINNPIGQATKATFLNDLSAFKSELNTYVTSQYTNTLGSFDPTRLQADENSLTYMGTVDTSKNINDIIPSLNQNKKYTGSFEIINGRLAYSGIDTSQQEWAREQRLPVLATDYPDVTIVPTGNMIAGSGTDVIYNIQITSAAEITTVNLEGKLEVLDGSGTPIAAQPTIIFDQLSGTPTDIIRQIRVTIKTDTLSEGSYLVRLRQGAIGNSLNLSNPKDSIDLAGFTIDNEAPVNPIITPNIMTWTNDSVDVAIKYSEDTVVMQYSLDTITWNTYNGAITVTDNGTTIYARGLDNAGNESGISTITIANIDKEAPTLDVTDGGTTSSSVRIQATAIDADGSGINPGSYQYSKDDGVTWTAAT